VVVFARAPELGRVKTRLAATLGDVEALAVYRELGARVMRAIDPRDAGPRGYGMPWRVVIACTPDGGAEAVRAWLGDRWPVRPQGTGDLGVRMATALADRFVAGADRVVVIGTDCPDVDAGVLADAFTRLHDHDAVLGPASDGGYYLIGMRRPLPALFAGVPWSSPDTLRVTLARAAEHAVSVALLHELHDVDTAADLAAWRARQAH
jgi:rSAM/selenodomain-associated transferase 1